MDERRDKGVLVNLLFQLRRCADEHAELPVSREIR
jgi:hypothetical protein